MDDKHSQALEDMELGLDTSWKSKLLVKHRRLVGMAIPAFFVQFFWWGLMIKYNKWYLFKTKYPMTITMIPGSVIAG